MSPVLGWVVWGGGWVRLRCCDRADVWLNWRPQSIHLNGRSPVWILIWLAKCCNRKYYYFLTFFWKSFRSNCIPEPTPTSPAHLLPTLALPAPPAPPSPALHCSVPLYTDLFRVESCSTSDTLVIPEVLTWSQVTSPPPPHTIPPSPGPPSPALLGSSLRWPVWSWILFHMWHTCDPWGSHEKPDGASDQIYLQTWLGICHTDELFVCVINKLSWYSRQSWLEQLVIRYLTPGLNCVQEVTLQKKSEICYQIYWRC